MEPAQNEFIISLSTASLIWINYNDPAYASLIRPDAAKHGSVVIGVGNSSLADSRHDIDLRGDLKCYKEAQFVLDKNKLTVEAFFDYYEANFTWNEAALFINGICARRKTMPSNLKTGHEQRKFVIEFDI